MIVVWKFRVSKISVIIGYIGTVNYTVTPAYCIIFFLILMKPHSNRLCVIYRFLEVFSNDSVEIKCFKLKAEMSKS